MVRDDQSRLWTAPAKARTETPGAIDPAGQRGEPGEVPDTVIAPALELAWVVARVGAEARPPIRVPGPLRPLMRFSKLNATALATLRRVLEEDEDFRSRVAMAVTEELGRPSMVFLQRGEGWQEELTALSNDMTAAAAEYEVDRAERAAVAKLTALEGALRRAEAMAATARVSNDRAMAELATERRERRQAEEHLSELTRRVARVVDERDAARRRVAETLAELRAVQTEMAVLKKQLADRDVIPARETAGLALAEASAGAAALSAALQRVAAALAAPQAPRPAPSRPARAERSSSVPAVGRRPVPLPPAVFDDSSQAAEFLVKVPGVMVLIDGYNATLAAWATLSLGEQRARLLDAASELAARTGAQVHVVFDGSEQPARQPPPEGRKGLRWSFSPPGVEADDVLLAMVDATETSRPVVVASSDRRVRDGVCQRGGNAISVAQLFAVIRRDLR